MVEQIRYFNIETMTGFGIQLHSVIVTAVQTVLRRIGLDVLFTSSPLQPLSHNNKTCCFVSRITFLNWMLLLYFSYVTLYVIAATQ